VTDTARETGVALIARYIAPHPANPGRDEYWLPAYGYSVWVIAGDLSPDAANAAVVAREYGIPLEAVEAVEAVWAYYCRHRALIDNRLAQNRVV